MQWSSGMMRDQSHCGMGLGKGVWVASAPTSQVIVRPGKEQLGFNVGSPAILVVGLEWIPDLLTAVLSPQRQRLTTGAQGKGAT